MEFEDYSVAGAMAGVFMADENESASQGKKESSPQGRKKTKTEAKSKSLTREEIVAEMEYKGVLLPIYDWKDKEFLEKIDKIVDVWFEKNPEIIKFSGDFKKKYPNKSKALGILDKMTAKRRIKPDEFLTLLEEIFNF